MKKYWGVSVSINLQNCNYNLIRSPEAINKFVIMLCDLIDMKRHGPLILERFGSGVLEGISAMQFIETSSITIHFDEEENRAFIDIFSCKEFDPKIAAEFCMQYFKSTSKKFVVIIRD